MLTVFDCAAGTFVDLLVAYRLSMELLPDGRSINGSFWGGPEAGIIGDRVIVRGDTPVHSLLHEISHIICMTPYRRRKLDGNAGGGELEECAVCYLQIVLAGLLDGVGRTRLMQDMDDWGYSFRLGSARRWFEEDADDAQSWLRNHGLLRANGLPTFRVRQS